MAQLHLGTFYGVLLDRYGNAVAGRGVKLRIEGTNVEFDAFEPSDDKGRFEVRAIPPETYEVLVEDETDPTLFSYADTKSHVVPQMMFKQVKHAEIVDPGGPNPDLRLELLKTSDIPLDSSGNSLFPFTVVYLRQTDQTPPMDNQRWTNIYAEGQTGGGLLLRCPDPAFSLPDAGSPGFADFLLRNFLVVQEVLPTAGSGNFLPLTGGAMQGNISLNNHHIDMGGSGNLINGGSIGVGTDTPANGIDVAGGVAIGSGYAGSSAPTDGLMVEGKLGLGVSVPLNKTDIAGNVVIGSTYAGAESAPADGLLVEGDVGIGTTAPSERLHVVGNAVVDGDLSLNSHHVSDLAEPVNDADAATKEYVDTTSYEAAATAVMHVGLMAPGALSDNTLLPTKVFVPRDCRILKVLAFADTAPSTGDLTFRVRYKAQDGDVPAAPEGILPGDPPDTFDIANAANYLTPVETGFTVRETTSYNLLAGDVLELFVVNAAGAENLTVTLVCR